MRPIPPNPLRLTANNRILLRMANKRYKLTVILGEWHKAKLDAYCERTDQNFTEAFKCWLANLPDAESPPIPEPKPNPEPKD